jgi:outer membrane protein OmpA-like peptidoglycan-associated protein
MLPSGDGVTRACALAGALLLAATAGGAAQSAGTVEFGGFGRYSRLDDKLGLDNNRFGGGGSLGIYFVRNLALEAEASYTETHDAASRTISSIPIRGRLLFNVPLGGHASSIQLGAGYVYDMYRTSVDFKSHGATGLAGFRIGITEGWAFRAAATADYVPSPRQPGIDHYLNWGGQGGFTILFGNRTDSDRDGVADGRDRCPGTPRGERVDAQGCAASQRDTDRDGVKDDRDRCPGTPAGERVDAEGCADSQKDADRDGITDARDRCPDTPAGESVDENGCSAGQRDADQDGVPDIRDRCPNTPGGEVPDENGCSRSQRDTDGDGVPDSRDKCPGTQSGQAVDENGCPILFQPGRRTVILRGVHFETGRANLTPESEVVLQDVAQSLAANPEVRVQVSGHTDARGSRALNLRLSQARAEAVRNFLVAHGVAPSQLTAKGFGPDRPVATNKTAAGRARNRRVELDRLN